MAACRTSDTALRQHSVVVKNNRDRAIPSNMVEMIPLNAQKPTMEQWRRAYTLAREVHDLAPWTWMDDISHWGFMDPKDASPRFISIMGKAGEHFAVAVYRRVEDLFHILDMIDDPGANSDAMLETSQLQLSFEYRDYLAPADMQIIKELKLKFRGSQAWPCFRGFLPGQFPWQVDSDELRLLTLALEQVLAVAPRFKDDVDGLNHLTNLGMEEHIFLLRTPLGQTESSEWQESMVKIEQPAAPEITPELNADLLERAKHLPVVANELEVDIRMLPSPVQEHPGERPFFPSVLLVIERDGGAVFGCEIMAPVPTLATVHLRAAGALLAMLVKQNIRPEKLHVRTAQTASLLRGLCENLDIRLTVRPSLPRLEDAFTSLLRFSARK